MNDLATAPGRRALPAFGTVTLAAALALGLAACADTAPSAPDAASLARATAQANAHGRTMQLGPESALGHGAVRTYIVREGQHGHPVEIGLRIDERALDGLPTEAPADGSELNTDLALPSDNPTPFRFVELDWNPNGHEPDGVYTLPHFDFHFYMIDEAVRDAILPSDPNYGAEAANLPAAMYRPPFYVDASTAAGGAPAAAVSVPRMGLHWLDTRAPELQNLLGNPAGYQPFTKTFIYGSWDGRFTFFEPMITRAYIMSKRDATDPAVRDEVTPISQASHFHAAGWYPGAYRIAYDAREKAYYIALTQLAYKSN